VGIVADRRDCCKRKKNRGNRQSCGVVHLVILIKKWSEYRATVSWLQQKTGETEVSHAWCCNCFLPLTNDLVGVNQRLMSPYFGDLAEWLCKAV